MPTLDKQKLLISLLLILISVVSIRCSTSDDPVINQQNREMPKLDLSDAVSLVAYSPDAASGRSNLYKITGQGSLEKIEFVNADGSAIDSTKSITKIVVTEILKINKAYLLLSGEFTAWDSTGTQKIFTHLLLKKNDGALYDFGPDGIPNVNDFSMGVVQNDFNDDAYYANNEGGVTKLDLTDSSHITKTAYLYSGQRSIRFSIDGAGNCFYTPDYMNYKVRKASGGMYESQPVSNFWTGSNGKFYYQPSRNGVVGTITITNEAAILDTVTVTDYYFNGPDYHTYPIRRGTAIIFIDLDYQNHFEFNESTNTLTPIELPSFSTRKILVQSKNSFYIAGGTKLFKVNLNDYAYNQLLELGTFEIYSMSVSSDDVLQFVALRYTDGQIVLGQIDNNGALNIIEGNSPNNIIVVQPLNY